jgi:3-oxoacyl-[acyl-carrier-protein] synthase-3
MNPRIRAIRYHLPEKVLDNAELSRAFPEWSIEKIAEKTGIDRRHIAAENECSSDLGVAAAKRLFAEDGVDPRSIDFVLFCSQSPDYFLPTTACLIQDRLGLRQDVGALDFNLGCSGFVFGLSLARGLIATGDARNVLLITAETYSKFIHPKDKSARTIFGDGAAATLISAEESGAPGLGPFVFGTDGRGANHLIVPTGGMRERAVGRQPDVTDADGNVRNHDSLFMDGTEIFSFTLQRVPPMVDALLTRAGLQISQVDQFVFHQANKYMLEAIRKKMKIPPERFFVSLTETGNTVSATIPIALAQARTQGRVGAGSTVVLVGFGVGYSWGACVARL